MPNILDTVQISGSSYDLKDKNAPSVSAVTQQEYDNLPSSAKTSNTFFVITDAQAGDLSQYWTSAQTQSAITQATAAKQDTLVSGTNIKTINNESILGSGNIDIQGGGGGSSYSAGTNIDITNDIISCTLNASNGAGDYSFKEGWATYANNRCAHAEGEQTIASGLYSHAEGYLTTASAYYSHTEGRATNATNQSEHASGQFNNSVTASTTFGDSGNTLFSVGNGTANNARHNAFEIRQNGDIYITSGGTDIKLQDNLGGSGYVTTDTEQTISGRKIFTYSANSGKAIEFKQTSNSAKVGFRIINSAATNNEVATFEFRPDTYTDSSSVKHPLLYLGHYRRTSIANAGVPQTMVGFRQYDQSGGAAYHYLMPLPAEAKTPFSLTTSFKNYFAPLGFKNGSTMITADDTGVVDLSSELGGLKLVKLTQAEYDALATKDSNTLYVVTDS